MNSVHSGLVLIKYNSLSLFIKKIFHPKLCKRKEIKIGEPSACSFPYLMAICRNLYLFLTDFISKKADFIKTYFRLKKFIFRFMVVPSQWITRGRQQMLKLFSTRKYHLFWGSDYHIFKVDGKINLIDNFI